MEEPEVCFADVASATGGSTRGTSPHAAAQTACVTGDVLDVLHSIHAIAAALQRATVLTPAAGASTHATVDLAAGVFTVHMSDVQSALRHVGDVLQHTAKRLSQTVEDQIVEFYRHMQQNVVAEHELLRSTRTLVPNDPSLMKHLHFAGCSGTEKRGLSPKRGGDGNVAGARLGGGAGRSGGHHHHGGGGSGHGAHAEGSGGLPASPTQSFDHTAIGVGGFRGTSPPTAGGAGHPTTCSSHGGGGTAGGGSSKFKEGTAVKDVLRSTLYLLLEGCLQLTDATRGALYLRVSEDSEYLRRVCDINAQDAMPLDVSPAAGSTLGTVVRHHIGITIAKSRADHPEGLERLSHASQAVRSSVAIKVHNAVIVPMPGAIGCVIIADKASHESRFSMVDEHHALSLAAMVAGIIRRYPHKAFMEKVSPSWQAMLLGHAELPPILPIDDPTVANHRINDELDACLDRMLPSLDDLLPKPTRLVMIKANPQFASLLSAKNFEGCERAELNDEDLLESAVPYIKNLESLWRRSIEAMTTLRSDCETWSREMERKNARISELESEGRTLWRQYVALKADVMRLKLATVPQQLKETLQGLPGDSPRRDSSQPLSPIAAKLRQVTPMTTTTNNNNLGVVTSGAKFGREKKRHSSVVPLTSGAAANIPPQQRGAPLTPRAPLTAR